MNTIIKVLFICHGNICRSPMAEFVMKDMVRKKGLEDQFYIASAATSSEEIWGNVGNPVYPPARRTLLKHGIDPGDKRARQTTKSDYNEYDYLIGMDGANLRSMKRIYKGDPEGKISSLLDYAGRRGEEVADPWYTGDFDATWRDVVDGCSGLLAHLIRNGNLSGSSHRHQTGSLPMKSPAGSIERQGDLRCLVWVSSVTGNTREIAETLIRRLKKLGFVPYIKTSSEKMTKEMARKLQVRSSADEEERFLEGVPVILCFWCRRGSMDDNSLGFLRGLSGRNVLAYGTMGSYPESEYGQAVALSVAKLVEEKNHLSGLFLCRGRIDSQRTEKRRKLPKDHRHYLDDVAYERHLSSRSHPDEEDKKNAVAFLDDKVIEWCDSENRPLIHL